MRRLLATLLVVGAMSGVASSANALCYALMDGMGSWGPYGHSVCYENNWLFGDWLDWTA